MNTTVFNPTEQNERTYLEVIKQRITAEIDDTSQSVSEHKKDVAEFKEYFWENRDSMDRMEKLAVRKSITQTILIGEKVDAKRKRLFRLLKTPWFGRIDFKPDDDDLPVPIYIGIHSFYDNEHNINLIYDWRAPVSAMYYDYETGPAILAAPSGNTSGEITLKRQYRIREGKMEFMIENALNIQDDILQKELAQTSDNRMKNIVATIQRDQNLIIRNEQAPVLIIQGVAGSGKTSIALHRIAFLLYRNPQTINSNDILIISPNKVFADYISNVLPELGEQKIRETGMEDLAGEILQHKVKFQLFSEQITRLLEKPDEDFISRIRFKASHEIVTKLNEFVLHIENNCFTPRDIVVKKYPVPAWFFEERFKAYHRLPLMKRLPAIVKDTADNIRIFYNYDVTAKERNEIKKAIDSMFVNTNLRKLYKEFYDWLGKPELLQMLKGTTYEFADVFPMIYLNILLEGIKPYTNVKHLLVDEMQDYTPVQYSVIAKLFSCNKTLLGDRFQSVNPYSSSCAEDIGNVFPEATIMELFTSYRSTFEITAFVQKIQFNEKINAVYRHGPAPKMFTSNNQKEEIEIIIQEINQFSQSNFNTMGIICKFQKQADLLHEILEIGGLKTSLLTDESISFFNGVHITTPWLAKGLEFDQVIVPFCTPENYSTEMDRHLLYVACTRAMHRLTVTGTGKITSLINGE